MLSVSIDSDIDYGLTAQLGNEAFASPEVSLSADRLRWFYETSFARGTIVMALWDEGTKIGHAALVKQPAVINGVEASAAQFVDLFILRKYRSRGSLRKIYDEIERQCRANDIRYLLAMPNAKAGPVNRFFLKLEPVLTLPIRAGISLLPPLSKKLRFSGYLKELQKSAAVELFAAFDTAASENGLKWDGEHLYRRLDGPDSSFGIHATDDLLLISSPRTKKGIGYTLLCALFARPQTRISRGDVRNLVRAACRLWGQPVFIYAGINTAVSSMPGAELPARLRPSPMQLQLRDFEAGPPFKLDRFQLIDFDIV
jgi:GNAT superfamily N-acetyltransferase